MRLGRLATPLAVLVIGLATVLAAAGCGGSDGPRVIAVAAGKDTESVVLANLYAAALRYYGNASRVITVADPLNSLDSAEAEVAPGFTGRLLRRLEPHAAARSGAQVYRELLSALPEGVAAGDYALSADDKPAVAVTEGTARAWGGSDAAADVSALRRHCTPLSTGVVTGAHAPTQLGSCRLPKPREFPDTAALFGALRAGQVNVAWTTTAAPDTPSDVVVLSDRTSLIQAENPVPLYRRNELNEAQVVAVNEVAGVLDTAALSDMRRQVDKGADPVGVADAFLAANPLRH